MNVFMASLFVKKLTKFCNVNPPSASVKAYTPISTNGNITKQIINSA
jgi:hypothetical protein